MSTAKSSSPSKSYSLEECFSILLDELQQATLWNRPCLLFAVHRSKYDQARSIKNMEDRLPSELFAVQSIIPKESLDNIPHEMIRLATSSKSIFFVRNLGNRLELYDGLNLFRELLIEKKLRMIFWLTEAELHNLAHRAPDIWAFRHRVVEFPSTSRSTNRILPAGVLLWHTQTLFTNQPRLIQEIENLEILLHNLSGGTGNLASYLEVASKLLHLYWFTGNDALFSHLFQETTKLMDVAKVDHAQSFLMNAKAISCYDQHEYKDALKWIEKALSLNPTAALLWCNYGIICRSAGLSRKSLPSINKAIKLNPGVAELSGALGYVHISTGKLPSAIVSFERAGAKRPNSTRYYPALAYCHQSLGNLNEFREIKSLVLSLTENDEYLRICMEGLEGYKHSALARLKAWIEKEKITRNFIQRDPHLQLIFRAEQLQQVI